MTETATQTTEEKAPPLSLKVLKGNLDKVVDSTNEAMDELREAMGEQAETNKAILSMLQAKNNPVILTDRVEADEEDLGDVADIGESQILTGNFDIGSPQFQNKEAIERFMREKVTIHIHESNNDLEVDIFSVSVNNKSVLFRFGETKTVPRYIVEVLARAKPITYGNKQVRGSDGVNRIVNKGARGLRYPFSIEKDTPVGRAWCKLVLNQD